MKGHNNDAASSAITEFIFFLSQIRKTFTQQNVQKKMGWGLDKRSYGSYVSLQSSLYWEVNKYMEK